MRRASQILTMGLSTVLLGHFLLAGLPAAGSGRASAAAVKAAGTPDKEKAPDESEKAFDDVIRSARKLDGLFPVYRKDDKVYVEILPEQFGRLYLMVPTLWTSVGFRSAGSYLPQSVFVWEKHDKKVLLTRKNTRFIARKSAMYKRALDSMVPDSIVHAFKIESAPHPQRKSVLVSLDDCFLADLLDLGKYFSPDKEHVYALDRNRCVWGEIKAFPGNVELEVRYTLASSNPPTEPSVPDPRSFTAGVRYSLSALPSDNGYRPRLADDRIGYFFDKLHDFDRLDIEGTAVRYIKRWRLEKRDPSAAVSEPKEPIVFWLENTVPPEYRAPLREGVLLWNKAFERAGFRNAVVVNQMPDDAGWDPADIRYNVIRWLPSLAGAGGAAFGPSRSNPFTGQILDADVVILAPMDFLLFDYPIMDAPLGSIAFGGAGRIVLPSSPPWVQDNYFAALERSSAVTELMIANGLSDPADIPESYTYDSLKWLACHEVGHTLGLRHNFKGSTTIPLSELQNTELTGRESIGNSIMEYPPVNVAPKGVAQGDYWQKTIGAWDYWTVEYGYVPIDAATPEDERPVLDGIASRSSEPQLAYGPDEDAYDFTDASTSLDPLCMTFDLSDDPVGFSAFEIQRVRDLWKKLDERALFPGRSYALLRRAFEITLYKYFGAEARLVKWLGGVHHSRAHVGDPGGALPFRPVDAAKQRQALELIKSTLFKPDALQFPAVFLQKLQKERFWDGDNMSPDPTAEELRIDFSLDSQLKSFYKQILGSLYDPFRLQRIQDNESRTEEEPLTLIAYLDDLHACVWQDVKDMKVIGNHRAMLQKEFLSRVSGLLLKPSPSMPGLAVSICRHQLKGLDKSIRAYLHGKAGLDVATGAHLEDCSDIINETLKAVATKSLP
jgi:hypothetical protein